MTIESAPPARPLTLGLGLFAVGLPLGLVLNAQPLLAGALVDQARMSSTRVGLLFSLQALFAALVPILLASRMPSLRIDRIAVGGMLLWSLGSSIVWFEVSNRSTFAIMVLCGIGEGLLILAGGAGIAAARHPGRMAAFQAVLTALVSTAFVLAESAAIFSYGVTGGFLTLAGAGLLLVFPCALLPEKCPASERAVAARRLIASPLVVSSFIASIGASAVWLFSERIGVSIGMTLKEVANVLALTALTGIAGGVIASALSTKRLLKGGTALSCLGLGLCGAVVATSGSENTFAFGVGAMTFAYLVLLPMSAALAVKLDSSGALAGAVTGATVFASVFAPAIAGSLVENGSYLGLAVLSLVSGALAALVLLCVTENATNARAPEGLAL